MRGDMSEHWIDRLSDYLDGELSPEDRRALEAHAAACPDCAGALEDLRRIVHGATALEDAPPERDLWPGIAERLGLATAEPEVVPLAPRRTTASRRLSFSIPQLAAAAIAFLLIGAVGVGLLSDGDVPTTANGPAPTDTAPAVLVADSPAEAGYADAVAELTAALEQNRDRLDPRTVEVVERNLAIIDQAIADTRQALAADPGDPYLNRHLASTMQRKVEILRRATQAAI